MSSQDKEWEAFILSVIDSFKGEYSFLSNFYTVGFIYLDELWPSVEHAFQAVKSSDLATQSHVRAAKTPSEAKKRGRAVFLRKDWEEIKMRVMVELIYAKFYQNKCLQHRLLQTGDIKLIEGNWWHDNFWGDCCCDKCVGIVGRNMLGKILMNERRFA